jgi:hypothetical protein
VRNQREFSSNTGRSHARDLPQPAQWTNSVAKRVFENLSRPGTLTDLFLVEADRRPDCTAFPGTRPGHVHTEDCPVCAGLKQAYGDTPHVIAYRLWDEPGPRENAETYIARHLQHARQLLGGVPIIDGVVVR